MDFTTELLLVTMMIFCMNIIFVTGLKNVIYNFLRNKTKLTDKVSQRASITIMVLALIITCSFSINFLCNYVEERNAEVAALALQEEQQEKQRAAELFQRNKEQLNNLLIEYAGKEIIMLKYFNETTSEADSDISGKIVYSGSSLQLIHKWYRGRKNVSLTQYTTLNNGFFDFAYCVDVEYLPGGNIKYKTENNTTNYIDSHIVKTQPITQDYLKYFELSY